MYPSIVVALCEDVHVVCLSVHFAELFHPHLRAKECEFGSVVHFVLTNIFLIGCLFVCVFVYTLVFPPMQKPTDSSQFPFNYQHFVRLSMDSFHMVVVECFSCLTATYG